MICVGLLVMWCHAASPAPPAGNFCDIYKPVRWSPADTRGTKEQADKNNRKWKALCGGRK